MKPFGFGGGGNESDGGGSCGSDVSDDDRDTVVPSPMSQSQPESPAPGIPGSSQDSTGSGTATPKSALRTSMKASNKRRRLTWEDESDSSQTSQGSKGSQQSGRRVKRKKDKDKDHAQYPKLRLNESELDSLSFTSHSPGLGQRGSGDLDSSNFQNAKALHEVTDLVSYLVYSK